MRPSMAWALATALLASGCAMPQDPDGTLEGIRTSGEVVVGASLAVPDLVISADGVSGPEADLIEGWAEAQGVRVRWEPGGEEGLVTRLEHGDVDLVVGGITADTPWEKRAGVTRPYAEDVDAFGRTVERVVLVPRGENALVMSLESYFDDRRAS